MTRGTEILASHIEDEIAGLLTEAWNERPWLTHAVLTDDLRILLASVRQLRARLA